MLSSVFRSFLSTFTPPQELCSPVRRGAGVRRGDRAASRKAIARVVGTAGSTSLEQRHLSPTELVGLVQLVILQKHSISAPYFDVYDVAAWLIEL